MPLLPEKTEAQMLSTPYAYPKRFRFTGLVELTYRDYSITTTYNERKSESEWTSFGQIYKLGVRGYIYHPKFISFSTSVAFGKENIDYDSGDESDSNNINYNFSVSVLPTTPVSLDIYGLKTDSNIEGWGALHYNIISNSYGARLCFTKTHYPLIRLEYNHWDYTIERNRKWVLNTYELIIKERTVQEKTESNRFSAYINGYIKLINTNYNLTGDLSDYSSPFRKYDGKNLIANTYTTIKKENILSTSFIHSDIDVTKLTSFRTNLTLFPIGRLHHSYVYEYFTSEYLSDAEKLEYGSHTIGNYLLYKFSKLIYGTTRWNYKFGNRDGSKEDSYNINTQLNYGTTIKDFDFISYYKFSLSKDESRGEYKFMENSMGIGLSTRKFRWGKIYSNYDFSFYDYDFNYSLKENDFYDSYYEYDFTDSEFEDLYAVSEKAHSTEHRIRVGINGKGPGRAYWNMEAEGRIFDTEMQDHRNSFWIGERQWAEKIRHYTFTGDIGYPVGQRGLATFNASYTTGQTNSKNVEKYYYEGRLNYRILRNLNLLAWWREEWRNKGWWAGRYIVERQYGWKTREYQMELQYLIYRVTVSLEYNVYRLEEGPFSSEYKRLFVKMRRPF